MPVKRKGRTNYTKMTLELLRNEGCSVEKVEKFNAFAGPFGQREDAFGFIDIIALDPAKQKIIAIQSTGPSGHRDHIVKILANPFARQWLECGGQIQMWSWRKLLVAKGMKARRWRPRIENITLRMFDQ